jgi:hypothetical protein
MRAQRIFVFLIMVLGLIVLQVFGGQRSSDDYGKFEGWILDPKSGNPVNEVFWIDLLNCCRFESEARIYRHRKTDEKGYFSFEVDPGQYCLHIEPESEDSVYCIEPYQFYHDQFNFPVMIEAGKITETRKKATYGGSIKVRILDTKGKIVNPATDLPQGASVHISVTSPYYIIGIPLDATLENKGETVINRFFPSSYSIRVDFHGTGYKRLRYNNVQVKECEITKIDCVIDLEDITGIEGRVVDENGTPWKGIEVFMVPNFHVGGGFSSFTDIDGYFRISGLPVGEYNIGISKLHRGTKIFNDIFEIKKGILIRKDLIFKRHSSKK